MDDLTVIRSFRAEDADGDPDARAAAWRALEAKFESASPPAQARPARPLRRGLLALAGAATLSAFVAGLLILSSGPAAEPAAAEVLHATAAIAAESPAVLPGPGEFLYTKSSALEFEGWTRGRGPSYGATTALPGAFAALVPTVREFWISPEGAGRSREVLGTPRFLSSAEQRRWEEAGSPLPSPFEPGTKRPHVGDGARVLESARGVLDIELPAQEGFGPDIGFPGLADLPTEPEALRLAIQNREPGAILNEHGGKPAGEPLDTEETIGELMSILSQPNATPPLRAAAFDAIAELPGIELDRDAADLLGRSGYAIRYADKHSLRNEYIVDSETSTVLGERTVLLDPERSPMWEQIPAGTALRDVAYLQTEVVNSMDRAVTSASSPSH
jgi:hypothetical protein